MGWQAALTKSSRSSTARWGGLGERDEKVYERNQCPKPRYVEPAPNLADMGRPVVRVDLIVVKRPLIRAAGAGGLPVGKVCGVPAGAIGAKLGASLVDRNQVNVGTTPGLSLPGPNRDLGRVGVIAH